MKIKMKKLLVPAVSAAFCAAFFTAALVSRPEPEEKEGFTKTLLYQTDSEENQISTFDEELSQDGITYVLSGIDYNIAAAIETETGEELSLTVASGWLPAGEAYEPDRMMEQDGVSYAFAASSVTDTAVFEDSVTQDYPSAASVPDTLTQEVINPVTGQTENAVYVLKNVEERTVSHKKSVTMTVSGYEAGVYSFNGVILPACGEPFAGYEYLILEAAGMEPDSVSGVDVSWNGEAYVSGGVSCRDITAVITWQNTVYEAAYEMSCEYVLYETVYTAQRTDTGYIIQAAAFYTPVSMVHQELFLRLSAAFLLVFIISLVFYAVSGRKKEGNHAEV